MMLTLDTNCLIEVEDNEPAAGEVRRLLAKHDEGAIDLQVAGIMASERLRTGGYAPTFASFAERVEALTTRPIRVLRPMGRFDVTYWDEGVWADDSMVALEAKIHSILFSQPYEWAAVATADGKDPMIAADENDATLRKWRNRLCDSAAMWCHIHYGGDVFVTRDANFLTPSKRAALEALGAKRVSDPAEACAIIGA